MVKLLGWTSQVFGNLGIASGKISISALLLAIMRLTELKWQRLYLWTVTITLAGSIAIAWAILSLAQCRPAAALWDARVEGTCVDPEVISGFGTFLGSFNSFADASLALIPITIFWQLNNGTLEKIQLSIVFALNILTSICSEIKTQYLAAALANRTDPTWATFDIFTWITAELFLMIVCGTILTLHPLLLFLRGLFGRLTPGCGCGLTEERAARSTLTLELGERIKTQANESQSTKTGPRKRSMTLLGDESHDNLVT